MPTAKKKKAAAPKKKIYFLRGSYCSNGDVCHPDPDDGKSAWREDASVCGPFTSIEAGLKWYEDEVTDLGNDEVLFVIDGTSITRHVVKAATPILVAKPR